MRLRELGFDYRINMHVRLRDVRSRNRLLGVRNEPCASFALIKLACGFHERDESFSHWRGWSFGEAPD